ncbi:MAG: acyl-CoA dehydrogenase [Candidatus Dadabacteria bacterium]|nr:MAG: acyl-CoA dehydrogenase [Candidatus Dadabacteria bacterium]
MARPSYRTAELEEFRAAFRAFVDAEVAPHVGEWERCGELPRSFWRAMGRYGYLCPWLDECFGGTAAPFGYSVVICEELGRAAMGVQTAVSVHSDIAAPYLARYARDDLKRRWLPGCASGELVTAIAMTEPGAGSDLAAIRTVAERRGDEYILRGQKTFITNGMSCDLVVVAAKTDPKAEPPHAGISLLAVESDSAGFVKSRKLEKMGQRCGDTAELFFDDCRVPGAHLLGEEGAGFRYLMENLQRERLMIAIAAQAAAEQILEKTLRYVRERRVFGRPVGAHQHNAFKLAERATEVEIGRAFVDAVIDEFIAGEDVTRHVSMAKWWTSDLANRVAYDAVQLHGGYGYMAEVPVARDYVDVRAIPIYAGSNEVMKLILARILGLAD